ncbi:hypothetical protein BP00DRAFT_423319 [Aspergillus indologenus CBS 114.80]|uniref:Uncharacterized protein n=1 Tax=Aspergillus indologenus CBS 114.80 TaxID=1450541 RepID=A0A2V5IZ19_9EURO|nr:hypothetical protein BP00DRAFT_423319 [Aspergillus indologenus CBS 114.80]
MCDTSEIREKVFEKAEAQRLVIKVHTEQLDSYNYRVSASNFINKIFPNWENDNRIRFIAIEIRGDRTFLAIDVINLNYNFETAHKTEIVLPVYIVWRHKRKGWFIIRWPQEDEPLATKIAELHDLNGFDTTTPFLANFNESVVYRNPCYISSNRQHLQAISPAYERV